MELPAALRVPAILSYDPVAYDLRGKAVELLAQAEGIGFFETRCLEESLGAERHIFSISYIYIIIYIIVLHDIYSFSTLSMR